MSHLKIYGVTRSRALRPLWAAEELGLDFDHEPTRFWDGSTRTPEFLALNPNGQVPVLVDDDLKLGESLAITLYLARKFDQGLWPKSIADEGLAYQWTLWAATQLERPALDVLLHRVAYPEDKRDPAKAEAGEAAVRAPLGVLDAALNGRPYLLGENFTVADLNVAGIVYFLKGAKFDLSAWPNVAAWIDRCFARPAFARTQARK